MGNSPQVIDLTLDSDSDRECEQEKKEEIIGRRGGRNRATFRSGPIKIDGNTLNHQHHFILSHGAWFTDEIINSYLYCLHQTATKTNNNDLHPVDWHYFSTFFYTKLKSKDGIEAVMRWSKGIDLLTKKLVIIPVNVGNTHWVLVTWSPKERVIRYYDSMMDRGKGRRILELIKSYVLAYTERHGSTETDEEAKSSSQQTRKKSKDEEEVGLLGYLLAKMQLKTPSSSSVVTNTSTQSSALESDLKLEIPPGLPQQTDGSSCGAFVCKYATCLINREPLTFSQDGVNRFRLSLIDTFEAFQQSNLSNKQ